MEATKLNCRITIQSATTTRGGTGEEIKSWSTFHECFAAIKPTSGTEKYINQQLIAEATHQVAIRFKTGITPKMRVLYGTRVFDIQAVHDIDERHGEMRLICKELV